MDDNDLKTAWRQFEASIILSNDYFVNAQCKIKELQQHGQALAEMYRESKKELERENNKLKKYIEELEEKLKTKKS
jgi:hypothetical protein